MSIHPGVTDAGSGLPPRAALVRAARGVWTALLGGILVGCLTGGVLGRALMSLLAKLNPENAGMQSDDGFPIGRVTLTGSLDLLLNTALIGLFGGLVYAGARHLTFGPAWFRVLSVTLGAALPVGALLVHTDGVDFTLLSPAWLGVAGFVAVPGLFGLLMATLVERRLPPPPGWGRYQPLRWVLRAAAAGVIAVSLASVVGDLLVLT